jgi:hypothetical protein
MNPVKQLFRLYIHGSMHVALAVFSLVLMTYHMFDKPFNAPMALFAFFGTMFSYNFMKYESLYKFKKPGTPFVKAVVTLSILALLGAGICFLFLERKTQVIGIAFLILTAIYTVPFFPNQTNLRNWSGVKIYIVAFCWAGVTLVLPLINAGMNLSADIYIKFVQRFLLVLILILVFEIIDLKEDDPHLKTLPQAIGVRNTKLFNLFLLIPFYFLEFAKSWVDVRQLYVNIILVVTMALFTIFANPDRPKYYTLFWVESIPIVWLGLVVLADYL